MKFKFKDKVADVILLEVNCFNSEFASNVYNLFMVQMLELHGPSFKKLSSEVMSDNSGIAIAFTCNITAIIIP